MIFAGFHSDGAVFSAGSQTRGASGWSVATVVVTLLVTHRG